MCGLSLPSCRSSLSIVLPNAREDSEVKRLRNIESSFACFVSLGWPNLICYSSKLFALLCVFNTGLAKSACEFTFRKRTLMINIVKYKRDSIYSILLKILLTMRKFQRRRR